MKWFVACILVVLLLVGCVGAVPVTGAVTLVSSNNATITMAGAAGTCWFQWGMMPGADMSWRTKNQTPSGGACTETIRGSPILGGTKFYYRACDPTGCGADGSFTTAAVTPIPTTTFGSVFDNLTENNMDISLLGYQATAPYTWLIPGYAPIMWGVIFSFVFIGLWLRGRSVAIPSALGFMVGGFIFSMNYGLKIGIPPELAAIGQGAMYAAVAGMILSIIKK